MDGGGLRVWAIYPLGYVRAGTEETSYLLEIGDLFRKRIEECTLSDPRRIKSEVELFAHIEKHCAVFIVGPSRPNSFATQFSACIYINLAVRDVGLLLVEATVFEIAEAIINHLADGLCSLLPFSDRTIELPGWNGSQ